MPSPSPRVPICRGGTRASTSRRCCGPCRASRSRIGTTWRRASDWLSGDSDPGRSSASGACTSLSTAFRPRSRTDSPPSTTWTWLRWAASRSSGGLEPPCTATPQGASWSSSRRAPAPVPAQIVAGTSDGSWGLRTWLAEVTGTVDSIGYRASLSRYAFGGFRRNPVADDGSAYGGATRSILNGNVFFPLASGSMRLVVNYLDLAAANAGSLDVAQLALGDRRAYGYNVVQHVREDVRQGQVGRFMEGKAGGRYHRCRRLGTPPELSGPDPLHRGGRSTGMPGACAHSSGALAARPSAL